MLDLGVAPGMGEGVVVLCLKAFTVLALRRPFLTAQNRLAPAHILKMLDCLAKVSCARIMLQVAAFTVLLAASGGSSCPHTIGVNMFVIDDICHNNTCIIIVQRLSMCHC